MRIEETQCISATDLARNMAQTIDAVRISRTTVLITKGTKIIAQLAPPPKIGLSMQGLIGLLKSIPGLSATDSQLFTNDLKTIRSSAKLSANPWE